MSLDPNKTYLVWNGAEFPNSTSATFKSPAGSTIDWGDGTVETFDTASTTVNTHTYTDGKTEHTIVISGLTSIDDSAFMYCTSLTNITIGNSVTSISYQAFYRCSGLTSITIPNSVTSIGNQSFRHCTSLTSVTMPDSVTLIEESAFQNCTKLTQLILFPSTPPTLGSTNAIPANVQSIYVQQSSKAAYQAATNWTTFASKIISDNIYLSFVRFNQKNKEYIDEKISENISELGGGDLNIENGSGIDSIVQKYSGQVDETHFGNISEGESGAIFGEANSNSGNRAVVLGKMNRNSAPNSLIIGLGNGRGIGATPNIDALSGEQLFVFGVENSISNGDGNAVLGNENTLSDVRYTTIIGRGNIINNISRYESKCVVGRYNNQKRDTMFEVGVGDYNNRVNGLEVYKDGRAKVYGEPTENNDVVRKLELDKKLDKPSGNPTEDSFVKVSSTGSTSYKKVSELDVNALKVTVW